MIRDHLTKLMLRPSITGSPAAFYMVVAIGVPTAIRIAVDGFVSGCELTIYLPFVLFAAIFLGWKLATATALASAAIAETLIMGQHHSMFGSACSIYSTSVFLIGSAVLIAFVHALRSLFKRRLELLSSGGIVFSLEKGQAWASWYGHRSAVQLGPESHVAEMMQDFLAQLELGRRLTDPKR